MKTNLPYSENSIFSIILNQAKSHNAIDFSIGNPEISTPYGLTELIKRSIEDKKYFYAPMEGVPELRKSISEKIRFLYSKKYNYDTEITITAGATQAIYTALTSTINEGDEVIVFEPAFDTYGPVIEINGGKSVFVQLDPPDFKFDWDKVEKLVNGRTKMIIINSPHNPTGNILTSKDITRLKKIISGTKILLLSDEVYEHCLYDNNEHLSISKYPELSSRAFVVNSFGCLYGVPGFKIGYCTAPEKLTKEFRKIHQLIVNNVNTPIQYALAEFLNKKEEYAKAAEIYNKKRDLLNKILLDNNFKLRPSRGSIFQLANYENISEEEEFQFSQKLISDIGIATLPLTAFYHNHINNKYLRFSFAKPEGQILKTESLFKKL